MKTKLLLFAVFFLIISQTGFSQPYVPFLNNSSWNVVVAGFTGAQDFVINTGTDVIIGSNTYRKINDPVFGADTYIREDVAGKKVYRRVDNVDQLLYDFSLPVSGTFTTSSGSVYTVISITNVNVNGGTRRRFQLDNGFFGFSWIEGVGSPNHPLVPYYELPSDPYIYLTCSAQNGTTVYNHGIANGGTSTDCSMLLGIDNPNYLAQKIYFSPNPFNFELHISSVFNLDNVTLKLYNSLGQLVKEIKEINLQNYTLNRDNLNNGIYFMQVTHVRKIILRQKIIVQD